MSENNNNFLENISANCRNGGDGKDAECLPALKEVMDSTSGSDKAVTGSAQAQSMDYGKFSSDPADLPALTLAAGRHSGEAESAAHSVLVVDKSHHKTHVMQLVNGEVKDVLTVGDATGKGPSMTPVGKFQVIEKIWHPTWYPPPSIGGRPVPPGPHNPMGPAAIRTNAASGRILLHGTNAPDSIGNNASHGCIRHHNEDILRIFPLVHKGDKVFIVNDFAKAKITAQDF